MKKRVIIGALLGVAIIICSFCYYAFVYTLQLEQVSNQIEYKDNGFNMNSTIKLVSGSTFEEVENNINVKKIGTYNVSLKVKNRFGNTKDYTLSYDVKDTIAPSISNKKTSVTIKEGGKINVKKLVSAKDADKNVKITYEGNYDSSTAGTYKITPVATDSSGNSTKGSQITITVNRKNSPIFRNAAWGDSKSDVKKYETCTLYEMSDGDLMGIDSINGIEMMIRYEFSNDSLKKITINTAPYSVSDYYNGQSVGEDEWWTIDSYLEDYFGKAKEQRFRSTSSLSSYCDNYFQAVQLGYGMYYSKYQNSKANVEYLMTDDAGQGLYLMCYITKR